MTCFNKAGAVKFMLYSNLPYNIMEAIMAATCRVDIRLTETDNKTIVDAAQLMGVSITAFLRNAALEKATAMFDEEQHFTLSSKDFAQLNAAIAHGLSANSAMQKTLAAGANITHA
jgi:uncharacterized protein (DUF1778 family)